MSPYNFWKTTDIDGERRAGESEWMECRADELMADHTFLKRAAKDDILGSSDEFNARLIVELVADTITLHEISAEELLKKDVLTRLFKYAFYLHQQARNAALKQAESELDTLPLAA